MRVRDDHSRTFGDFCLFLSGWRRSDDSDSGSRSDAVWEWLKRKRRSEVPTVRQVTIGEVQISSGRIILADPMSMYDAVEIEGVPTGRFSVHAQIIRYPEGGERIAKVGMRCSSKVSETRRTIATIGVDSATVVMMDAEVNERHWQEVGPERIGHIGIPEHRTVARLIEKQVGLKSHPTSPISSDFQEPISEDLEKRITEYLQSFPQYAEFTFMYFSIKTMNTFERIQEAMSDRLWTEMVLDKSTEASLLVFRSGFGDGSYSVDGLHCSDELVGVEIEFIGPAQDKVLEAFPILRY